MALKIKVKYFYKNLEKLNKISKGDWIDLRSAVDIHLAAGQTAFIPLGVGMILPEGYEAHIAPRSSTFKNWGIMQTNSVGAIVWDPEIMAPLLRVRFGLDCDPQDLNLPAPALEASEADAGESYAYSDYIEGSVQNLSELAVGEE